MAATRTIRTAEALAPTAELRGMLAEMRREIDILRRRETLRETQQRKWKEELEHAARIQRQIAGATVPTVRGGRLSVFTHPAERVSGDLHFCRRTSDHTLSLCVADATGHGLAAGLIAAAVQGALSLAQMGRLSNKETLEQLSDQLCACAFADCDFVTAVLGEFDETTRVFRWARAGGPPPVLIRPGQFPRRLMSDGMPLGVEARSAFQAAEISLQQGDTMLIHTDGLEALHSRLTGSRDDNDFLCWVAPRIESLGQMVGAGRTEHDDITTLVLRLNESESLSNLRLPQ